MKVFQRKKIEAEKSFLRLNTNSPNIKKKALEKRRRNMKFTEPRDHIQKNLITVTPKREPMLVWNGKKKNSIRNMKNLIIDPTISY